MTSRGAAGRLGTGAALLFTLAGCGSPSPATGPAPASAAPAGPAWYAVAGGAPKVSGGVLDTTGPMAAQNGFDDAIVSVLVRVDGAITGEADLTARSPEVIAALHDVLDDLRPRPAT